MAVVMAVSVAMEDTGEVMVDWVMEEVLVMVDTAVDTEDMEAVMVH
jgi:hypothetical protein